MTKIICNCGDHTENKFGICETCEGLNECSRKELIGKLVKEFNMDTTILDYMNFETLYNTYLYRKEEKKKIQKYRKTYIEKHYHTPEAKARRQKYYQKSEVKARMKFKTREYQKTSKAKEYQKQYQKSEKYKEIKKIYHAKPEVIARKKELYNINKEKILVRARKRYYNNKEALDKKSVEIYYQKKQIKQFIEESEKRFFESEL